MLLWDLGCGIGRHLKFLHDYGFDVYGIDISDVAIRFTREWLDSVGVNAKNFVVGNTNDMPWEDGFSPQSVMVSL